MCLPAAMQHYSGRLFFMYLFITKKRISVGEN